MSKNKKIKQNALEALMIVVFMLSVMCIGSETATPFFGMGISAAALALLN